MNRDAQIRQLNDLYQLLADGRNGYDEAVGKSENAQLAKLLRGLALRRELMENELGAEIRRFKPDDHTQEGTLKGALHRAWMDIRSGLGKADGLAMLDECERGERYLLERLSTVIDDKDIAPSSKSLLLEHRGKVEESLAQVEMLRSTLASVEHGA